LDAVYIQEPALKNIPLCVVAKFASVFMAAALLVASPLVRADYVASAKEERDWAARIAKSPPSADTLGGAPYPGAKLDSRRSGEKTAENQGKPMVYVYLVRASLGDVRAYYNGPGRREAGVPILNESSGSVEIMYFMNQKKAAAPAAVSAQPANAAVPGAESATPSNTPAAPAAKAPAEPDTAKQAIDAVNALRGLFGR
jgi:hypothetical protein